MDFKRICSKSRRNLSLIHQIHENIKLFDSELLDRQSLLLGPFLINRGPYMVILDVGLTDDCKL